MLMDIFDYLIAKASLACDVGDSQIFFPPEGVLSFPSGFDGLFRWNALSERGHKARHADASHQLYFGINAYCSQMAQKTLDGVWKAIKKMRDKKAGRLAEKQARKKDKKKKKSSSNR